MNRNKTASIVLVIAFSCAATLAQRGPMMRMHPAPAAQQASPPAPVERPKSFDPAAMDKRVNPCEDFYQYACGSWRATHPIPADQSRWGRFNELAEYNRQLLRQILEKAEAPAPDRDPVTQKIGDFYYSCMNEQAANSDGIRPLQPVLERINSIHTRNEFVDTVAYLHTLGVPALFGFFSQPDLHNAQQEIAVVSQGGLGLPDRSYYVNNDAKSQETRDHYVAYMTNMFKLLGDDPATAQKEAQSILALETKLAQASFERVKMRDPKNRDHKMPVKQLAALAPDFEFQRFFLATGAPRFAQVNVVPPDFFQQVNNALNSASIDELKTYLRWHALNAYAPQLSDAFVNENFDFYGRYLNGQKQIQPRWKRCVALTDRELGEALGQPYVAETFGADGKARTLGMVQALEGALGEDIRQLSWMSAATKKQAEVKLAAITNKIGYPDKWRDYSSVNITRDDFLGNTERARAFEARRILNRIGRPLNKKEWGMTPPTVNAYYNPSENDINFPAGILQPPFFDKSADDAVNFGGIGVVIGHELTHGFDDQGSKFGPEGNFRNWWSAADLAEFDKRTSCIADEYSKFSPIPGVNLNGRLTLGENTADNGGVRVALMALHHRQAAEKTTGENIDGFTPDQRFFLSFAQIWCQNATPEISRLLAKTDPHSPGRFRVIGVVQNNSDFARAFNCKKGDKMVSDDACHVW